MQIYNDKIIPLCESNESDGIDVSGLIEVTSGWNPVVLQYGDKSQFEKYVRTVIDKVQIQIMTVDTEIYRMQL